MLGVQDGHSDTPILCFYVFECVCVCELPQGNKYSWWSVRILGRHSTEITFQSENAHQTATVLAAQKIGGRVHNVILCMNPSRRMKQSGAGAVH